MHFYPTQSHNASTLQSYQHFDKILLMFLYVLSGCADRRAEPAISIIPPDNAASLSTSAQSEHMLPESERAYLWDVEHLGFVMEQTVFGRLKKSTNDGSLSAWESYLADDATTTTLSLTESGIPLFGASATYVRLNAQSKASTRGKNEFLDWLRSIRNEMDRCSTSVGLVRLGPAAGRDFSGPWKSIWRIRMAGEHAGFPLEAVFDLSVDLAIVDEQLAEKSDWIRTVSVNDFRSFRANQQLMEETTADSGLVNVQRYDNWKESTFVPNTGGVYVTDFDLDGHLDLYVDDHRDYGRLYRGRGNGTFEDVTQDCGLDTTSDVRLWTVSCWGDFDGDGDDDLITQDKIYENLGDGKFRNVNDQTNLPLTPTTGYAIADYDLDGKLDLYVCHTSVYRVGQQAKSRVSWIDDGLGVDNVLYRNIGNWQFEDVTQKTGTGGNGSSCFAAVWLHANNDDRPDLFAINEFGRNSMLINNSEGAFGDGDVDPVFGGFSMGVAAGDYNNDGKTDLYVANMYSKAGNRILANVDLADYPVDVFRKLEEGTRGSKLYRSGGDSSWETVPAEDMYADVGWSYGPTFVDLDGDGWLDIYGTAGFKSVKRGEPDG